MCIAISFVLSMIKLFRMPQGGSVTPASMLPMVLFALACGPAQGIVAGCAYGLLQLIEDFYVIHPLQLLVDYPLAFAAVALCCLVNVLPIQNARVKLVVAVLLGYLGRYLMATISGAVFFAEVRGRAERVDLLAGLQHLLSGRRGRDLGGDRLHPRLRPAAGDDAQVRGEALTALRQRRDVI